MNTTIASSRTELGDGAPAGRAGLDPDWGTIRRIARGDESAITELGARHHRTISSIARRITGDAHLAEEVVLDVLFRLSREATAYRPNPAGAGPWLTTIAR